MNQRSWTQLLPWVTTFAVAMAFLESAVVVYLRAIYYPSGFNFPMAPIAPRIAVTELVREFATLVMLMAPGALMSKRRLDRFAWFCYSFAVWDLFYYVFLKLILGWPENLFTWDILFLLPVVWVGPVLAPCMVSIGLIILAVVLLWRKRREPNYRPASRQWVMLLAAGTMILWTFIEGPWNHLVSYRTRVSGADMFTAFNDYEPTRFHWDVFLLAYALAAIAVVGMARGALFRSAKQGVTRTTFPEGNVASTKDPDGDN